jgi:glycosyltransferase involved in cell wall biosynthesis
VTAKNIIQVSAYYPPHIGGQEYAVYYLASQLAKAGHHVRVSVSRMKGWVFGHAPIMPAFPAGLFRAASADTIVHLHIGQAFTPEVVWIVSKLRRFKYIAELHIDFEPSGPAGVLLPLYKRFVLKRVLHSAQSIITLNEQTLQTVRETYGYTGPAQIMRNGIDDALFRLDRPALPSEPPPTLRLVFIGRLSKQKNLLTMLEALTLTKRKVYLDLVGDGEERSALEQMIAARGLDNVTLHGPKGRDEVMEFYRTCHAAVMPSLYEAQPLGLLEALAAGVPIIGTNVIGVATHIKGAGIIVEPTAQGLADGIEQYYQRYSQLQTMIDRGHALADKFRWRNILKEYEGLYETVMGN